MPLRPRARLSDSSLSSCRPSVCRSRAFCCRLYGLLALQVARREREFGIRSALGATARQIIQLVARQGATLLALGFTAGALATYGTVRLLRNQWGEMPTPNLRRMRLRRDRAGAVR